MWNDLLLCRLHLEPLGGLVYEQSQSQGRQIGMVDDPNIMWTDLLLCRLHPEPIAGLVYEHGQSQGRQVGMVDYPNSMHHVD